MASNAYLRRMAHGGPVIPMLRRSCRKHAPVAVMAVDEPPGPADTGDAPVRIDRNGVWLARSGPITRRRVVKLYAKALRREEDGHYSLVAPCERYKVEVEDAPFVGVQLRARKSGRDQVLRISTNVEEEVEVNRAHPLRFVREADTDGFVPYVLMRGGLEARLTRSVAIELTALTAVESYGGAPHLGLWSSGVFFPICAMDIAEKG